MEETIKKWCDSNIAVNMCARGKIPKDHPIACLSIDKDERDDVLKKRKGELVYQESSYCDGSYSLADIYRLKDGTYNVYVDIGTAIFKEKGRLDFDRKLIKNSFTHLCEVVDYIFEHRIGNNGLIFELIRHINIKLPGFSGHRLSNFIDKNQTSLKDHIIFTLKQYPYDEFVDLVTDCLKENKNEIKLKSELKAIIKQNCPNLKDIISGVLTRHDGTDYQLEVKIKTALSRYKSSSSMLKNIDEKIERYVSVDDLLSAIISFNKLKIENEEKS